jgi:hypothetical protein
LSFGGEELTLAPSSLPLLSLLPLPDYADMMAKLETAHADMNGNGLDGMHDHKAEGKMSGCLHNIARLVGIPPATLHPHIARSPLRCTPTHPPRSPAAAPLCVRAPEHAQSLRPCRNSR